MLQISDTITICEKEIQYDAIRAQGAGGQNVNKVSTAIHLRFDIKNSSLPENIKERLLVIKDSRISKEGIVVIKAQTFRSQEKNREDALSRLKILILKAMERPKKRKPSRPSVNAKQKRMDHKSQRSQVKKLRGRVTKDA
ncbi:MAG: alternative ribosome rescue aminoacyl-tRNA hydrolase ArfB [Pseudomonadota bacterium]